jgi:hypothetical protein
MSNTLTEALHYANNKRTISNSIKNKLPSVPKLYPSYLEYRINNRIVRYDIPHYQQPLHHHQQFQQQRQLQRYPSYVENLMYPMYKQNHPNVDQFCRSYGYKKIVPEAPKLIRRVSKNKTVQPIQKQQPVILQIKSYDNQQTYYTTPNKSPNKSKSPTKSPNKSKTPSKSPIKIPSNI